MGSLPFARVSLMTCPSCPAPISISVYARLTRFDTTCSSSSYHQTAGCRCETIEDTRRALRHCLLSPSSSIPPRCSVGLKAVELLLCYASHTPFAPRTRIPSVAFTASVTVGFVTCSPLISLHSRRAANKSSSVSQACWISAPSELTPRHTLELVRRPTNETHISHVTFNELSARCHGQHVAAGGTSINSATFSRIRVSDYCKTVPLQLSREKKDGQECIVQSDIGHKSVCFFDPSERWL